jgi:hypothetical protein
MTSERCSSPVKQELRICNRDVGIVMDFNEMQNAKASDPNSVTVDGDSKTPIDKTSQLLKAWLPIFITEVGIHIDFNERHPQKTRTGII